MRSMPDESLKLWRARGICEWVGSHRAGKEGEVSEKVGGGSRVQDNLSLHEFQE